MKKRWASLIVLAGFALMFTQPAKADGIRVSFSSGTESRWDGHRDYRRDHHVNYRPVVRHRPFVMPIFYPAPQPRIYERTVYVDRPVIVQPVNYSANQISSTYVDGNGRACREYQTQIVVDGRAQSAYGTACLQPDGAWRVVD